MLKSGRVWAVGAMSGTSLDGVDAAMLETDGETVFGFGETGFQAYSNDQQEVLRAALGKWADEDVAEACEVVETVHAQVLSAFDQADLVGFHGQTLAHDPRGRGTHQIGDGALLAEILGKPVVWDFRSADVDLGGEGAPLAPFYHFALAKWMGATSPLAFLNLGGVGNLTWVDPSKSRPEDEGALLAFDTGPANAPMNDLMRARIGLERDEGGALAAQGHVEEGLVSAFLTLPYFSRMPPKSLDRDAFEQVFQKVEDLSDTDALATLAACAAASVSLGIDACPVPPERILVCGGGRHNATLMQMIAAVCRCPVSPVEEVGLDGDMLEAQAFAYLAVRVARGLPTSGPGTTGVRAAVGGGTVSIPSG